MNTDQIIAELRTLMLEWRRREKDSPYGFDENGNRIPACDGVECADELEQLVKRMNR